MYVFFMLQLYNFYQFSVNIQLMRILYLQIKSSMEPETKVVKQQKQVDQKAERRHRLLKNIFRNHREAAADKQFQELINEDKQFYVGYNHHRYGAFCLQATQLDKAEQHLLKAKQIIEEKFIFSNVYMNLGNLEAQKKDYNKAITFYQKVLQFSPHKNPQDFQQMNQIIFSGKLNSFNAYVDAHTNLAVMYIQINEFQKGFDLCKLSLELNPDQTEAMINFTDIMRQLGKKDQAINYTWTQIVEYTKKKVNPDYELFKPIKVNPWLPTRQEYKKQKKISVLCVKWGTRYPADYVNKLYAGIKRNTTWDIIFYCFTEDPTGLNQNIKIEPLQQGWKRWWGKVTLFNAKIQGKKFYIDLDMILTGNLDSLFEYEGQFTTLRTGDLACEKNHKDGYNSSVMIWQGDFLKPVYDALKQNFEVINRFIVRFDFWLEMTINNADFVQQLYPGKVIDFLADAQTTLPQDSAVVCFARKPKPEDYPAQWVKEYWVQ